MKTSEEYLTKELGDLRFTNPLNCSIMKSDTEGEKGSGRTEASSVTSPWNSSGQSWECQVSPVVALG